MDLEPIEVTARFSQDGKVTPLQFTWQGRTCQVESTGRYWQAKDEMHILVMANGGQVYELIFMAAEGLWRLRRPRQRRVA
jgi:hypothetical protein